MEQPTQRDSVFPQVWSLYQACRRSGTWAKLVLESGEDGETFSFTSKRPPVPVHVAAAVNPPRPQSTRSNKRKSPSNLKKDRVKWRAWLERKLEETKQSCREETGSQSERPPPILAPSFASVTSGIQLPTLAYTLTDPTTYTNPPPSTPSSEEDIYRCEEDSSEIITTPGGSQLTVLQPVPAGVYEKRGTSVLSDAPRLDPVLQEPADHSSGPCNQPGGGAHVQPGGGAHVKPGGAHVQPGGAHVQPGGAQPGEPCSPQARPQGLGPITPVVAKKTRMVFVPPPPTKKQLRRRAAMMEKNKTK